MKTFPAPAKTTRRMTAIVFSHSSESKVAKPRKFLFSHIWFGKVTDISYTSQTPPPPPPRFNLTSLICSRFLRYKTVWTWSCPVEKILSPPVRHLHGVLQPGHSYWAWCWGRGGQSGHITTHLKSNVWSDEIKSTSTAVRCSYGTSGLRKIPSNPTFSSSPLKTCQN